MNKKSVKPKRGRPSSYSEELAAEICQRISKGETLASICRDAHMPEVRTVSDWKRAHPTFSADFACARELGFDAIADECMAIADEVSRDTISTDHGERPDSEWIARSRLRVETRLKLLAKWCPKKYGEKLEVEQNGNLEISVTIRGEPLCKAQD